jgi:hypothetical protein
MYREILRESGVTRGTVGWEVQGGGTTAMKSFKWALEPVYKGMIRRSVGMRKLALNKQFTLCLQKV